jgi:CRP-like cAMP-binding protein
MINITPEGAVEVGTVGNEGFVGVPVLLQADSMPTRAFVQVRGHGYRMPSSTFEAIIAENPSIHKICSRYTMAFLNQVAQSVACNRLHVLEARCARWLLMTHDRVHGNDFVLTQEFLSYMLGVHRPAVTLAARILQKAGFIKYSRGKIAIVDRAGLEGASCGCYQTVREHYESLVV